MIRIELPQHLRTLARVKGEVQLDVNGPATMHEVVDALEIKYPMLSGTIRDQSTRRRRPLVRFFACGDDISHLPLEAALPSQIATGTEPLIIVGAIAGG
ncbi:MAG: MoaD/ThiS family protein [Verrucomicrobia bacterium]|nr:MoaD/ThiS family protein [Verrucomicrobiota bacterium]